VGNAVEWVNDHSFTPGTFLRKRQAPWTGNIDHLEKNPHKNIKLKKTQRRSWIPWLLSKKLPI